MMDTFPFICGFMVVPMAISKNTIICISGNDFANKQVMLLLIMRFRNEFTQNPCTTAFNHWNWAVTKLKKVRPHTDVTFQEHHID